MECSANFRTDFLICKFLPWNSATSSPRLKSTLRHCPSVSLSVDPKKREFLERTRNFEVLDHVSKIGLFQQNFAVNLALSPASYFKKQTFLKKEKQTNKKQNTKTQKIQIKRSPQIFFLNLSKNLEFQMTYFHVVTIRQVAKHPRSHNYNGPSHVSVNFAQKTGKSVLFKRKKLPILVWFWAFRSNHALPSRRGTHKEVHPCISEFY